MKLKSIKENITLENVKKSNYWDLISILVWNHYSDKEYQEEDKIEITESWYGKTHGGSSHSSDWNNTNYQQEGSFGNSLRMGGRIIGEMFRGLIPFPTKFVEFTDPLDIIMILGVEMFRVLMNIIIGIKIYVLLKNRDTE